MQIVNNRKSINGQGVSNGRIYNDYISAINGEYELYKLEGGIENGGLEYLKIYTATGY